MADEDFVDGETSSMNSKNKKIAIIAIILIIIIAAVLAVNYNLINLPNFSFDSQTKVLVLGQTELQQSVVFNNLKTDFTFEFRNPSNFPTNVSEQLQLYDIILLDQSRSVDKSLTVDFGSALQNYVKKGGKLIIVLNSGIYQRVGIDDLVATDVVGWETNLGDMIPVKCNLGSDSIPNCTMGKEINVVARIESEDLEHPIMKGIVITPPLNETAYILQTLNIQVTAGTKEIAKINDEASTQSYPAIVEKKSFPMGTVIYFNYDPSFTPGILTNTLKYLQ